MFPIPTILMMDQSLFCMFKALYCPQGEKKTTCLVSYFYSRYVAIVFLRYSWIWWKTAGKRVQSPFPCWCDILWNFCLRHIAVKFRQKVPKNTVHSTVPRRGYTGIIFQSQSNSWEARPNAGNECHWKHQGVTDPNPRGMRGDLEQGPP